MKRFEAEKFYLRDFKKEDWRAVHEYASQKIVSQYQPWGPNTEEDTLFYLEGILKDAQKKPRSRFAYAVIWRESDKLIGAGELIIRDFSNQHAEIGYILNPLYWGKGLATELALALIGLGFEEKKLHRIAATCAPDNIASQRVLEKAGMSREGRNREVLKLKEGWRDSLVYGILEHEWNGK